MQLLWGEPEAKAAGFAVIPFFLITDAPIGKDRQVLCVGFILQRPLDVIVGDQDWPGSVLGDGKERQQKNYCKKSESHKQKFTSRNGNQSNGRSTQSLAAKKAGDLLPAFG
jgi:hypothetical protein